jgi:hypothetical protein
MKEPDLMAEINHFCAADADLRGERSRVRLLPFAPSAADVRTRPKSPYRTQIFKSIGWRNGLGWDR